MARLWEQASTFGEVWSIGIYTGASPLDLEPMPGIANPVLTRTDVADVPASFVADPFMVRTAGIWHMFFEVMNWQSGKGEIGLAVSADGCRWTYRHIVLAEPFHLSYPYVFSWQDQFFLIPESFQASAIRLYKAADFPTRWAFAGTILEGPYLVDASVFRHAGRWWLFADASPAGRHDTLRLFFADDLLGPWREHPRSPIINGDPHHARPAGRVIVTDASILRFAQNCMPHYGTDVRAFEVVELTLDTYRERPASGMPVLTPGSESWNAAGMHHVDAHCLGDGSWIACVDGWCHPRIDPQMNADSAQNLRQSAQSADPIRTRILTGFDDPTCGPDHWEKLVHQGDTDVVFLTWHWLRSWWETLGEGDLLLVAAERSGAIVAVAPLYVTHGMIFFLGAGDGDYLDFIGDVSDPEVLAALLTTAREAAKCFEGFRLHFVLERSQTGQRLQEAARRVGLTCAVEGILPAPEVDLASDPEAVRKAVSGSMLKKEQKILRGGPLKVQHLRDIEAIRPCLAEYYAQHLARWQAKGCPSPFDNPKQRAFLERFLELAAPTGWIRFLRIDWNDRPLAFEFAWYYGGVHYSAPWCFAMEHARLSPGHVLLRQSVLAALDNNLRFYDLGGGDQEYKFRLPVQIKQCLTWGLYPTS